MDYPWVFGGYPGEDFGSAVGRMIVNYNHIEGESGFLRQGGSHRVGDGACAVADGDDDRGLHGKAPLGVVNMPCYRRKLCHDSCEVGSENLFTLLLHCGIARINIVKLFLPRSPAVIFRTDVKVFRNVTDMG